jgi:DNA-binding Lrp family transcriptional regulator
LRPLEELDLKSFKAALRRVLYLQHANIVKIYSAVIDQDETCVMEMRAFGKTLRYVTRGINLYEDQIS